MKLTPEQQAVLDGSKGAIMAKVMNTLVMYGDTSVLFLIPGVPLINSILDILEGHVLVGLSRTINATILIICIALGLSMTLLILGKDIL